MLDALLADDPGWGRALGLHEYDGKVQPCAPASIAARIERLRKARAEVDAVGSRPLDGDSALDAALLRSSIDGALFQLEDWEQWHKNPLFYQGLFGVNDYLDREYAPLAERARQLVAHEEAALREVGYVLSNLVAPLPRPVVETAVQVYSGYAEYLRGDVVRLVSTVGDATLQRRFASANAALAAQADAIARHLSAIELPRSDAGYALGATRFARFIKVQEGLDLPLDAFERLAAVDLAANQSAYDELARSVKETRPEASDLLAAATALTLDARSFLTDQALLTLSEGPEPLVRETPPFMRWNQAFLVAPGPFERDGLAAYYYITLPDPHWPKHKQHDYLLPFGTLVSTTVHETYPGHYVQGQWARRAPTRVQRAVSSYSFTEGWAHYAEQLMVDRGFKADRPETRLGQLVDALLRDCRFLGSVGLHARGQSVADVERAFIRDCHQDAASAHEQAVRGTFDPGYFAYTLGKLQFLALRHEAEQRLGPRFSLQRFHDAVLSHGAPPLPLIHDRVLAELEKGADAVPHAAP